jgi:hypothetical protein
MPTRDNQNQIQKIEHDEVYGVKKVSPFVDNGDGNLVRQPKIATEETLQAVLSAQGGSVYNYIQSAEDATYKYYGYASSTGWKIKRKTLATGVWEVAEGAGDYATAWADRATHSYSYT